MLERKNKIYLKPFAAACMLMLSACTSDESADGLPPSDKTLIELTAGIAGEGGAMTRGGNATTRTVTTTDIGLNPATKFATGTSLYMVMKSEEDAVPPGAAKYVRTIGYAQEEKDASNTYVRFASSPTDYRRFYEDSYSRKSLVSIYSACVPGYYLSGSAYIENGGDPTGTLASAISINSSTDYSNKNWTTTAPATNTDIAWPLHSTSVVHQTVANNFVSTQDLCFSNNVSNNASDTRIHWNDNPRGFIAARMVFYHALTKVTFKIIRANSFPAAEFTFTNANENLVLEGFKTTGTFNIEQGEFTSTGTTTISELAKTVHNASATAGSESFYELEGLLVPGTDLDGSDGSNPRITFTIGNNLYNLSKDKLLTALSGKTTNHTGTAALTAGNEMRAGVHYVFTLTVGKKEVDKLTAAVVDWETVTADNASPSNARIELSFLTPERDKVKEATPDIDLFRAPNTSGTINDAYESYAWLTGYAANKGRLTRTDPAGTYTAENATDPYTQWYWPDNKTFYHFRMLMPQGQTVTTNASDGDYITLTGHVYDNTPADSYVDVCWGAPFYALDASHLTTPLNAPKLTYNTTNGFDDYSGASPAHQISKAIGPTEGTINIVMFHMMSDVTIQLTTTVDDAPDHVTLSGATLSFSNIYQNGNVRMGNGKVEPTNLRAANNPLTGTVDGTYKWRYGFVPQPTEDVNGDGNTTPDDDVVLTITTADHNQYIVNMKDMVATTIGSNLIANPYTALTSGTNSGKYPINYWYPNYKYTYTFRLTKTGIALITATLADWETVPADVDNVKIK